MGESRGLVTATDGQQDQGKQMASDTTQQTLQMVAFPTTATKGSNAAIPMKLPGHEMWPQHSTWQMPLLHQTG
jgi:triacylglycerol esterase/lipase EstA (alpha/beta hydrolase family)